MLVKFTNFGDANLDGQLDASDYIQIDNGFANNLTGWFNGDFNGDGAVNGSDYTLIDDAFNTQGAVAQIAISESARQTNTITNAGLSTARNSPPANPFQVETSIAMDSYVPSIEESLLHKDLLDEMSAASWSRPLPKTPDPVPLSDQ